MHGGILNVRIDGEPAYLCPDSQLCGAEYGVNCPDHAICTAKRAVYISPPPSLPGRGGNWSWRIGTSRALIMIVGGMPPATGRR